NLPASAATGANFLPSHTFHPCACVPISKVLLLRASRAVITLLESPSAVVKFSILPLCSRDNPASVAIHKLPWASRVIAPTRSLPRPRACVHVSIDALVPALFQWVKPRRVPIHSEPSSSPSSERMKASGSPSADVNELTAPS